MEQQQPYQYYVPPEVPGARGGEEEAPLLGREQQHGTQYPGQQPPPYAADQPMGGPGEMPFDSGINPWVSSPLGRGSNAVIGALLSFIFPGLGHLMIGQTRKGIAYLVSFFLLQIICAVIVLVTVGILWAVYIIIPVFQIMVIIDAALIGARIDQGYPVQQGECSNGFTKFFVGPFIKPFESFVYTRPESAPTEWVAAVRVFETSRDNVARPPGPGGISV